MLFRARSTQKGVRLVGNKLISVQRKCVVIRIAATPDCWMWQRALGASHMTRLTFEKCCLAGGRIDLWHLLPAFWHGSNLLCGLITARPGRARLGMTLEPLIGSIGTQSCPVGALRRVPHLTTSEFDHFRTAQHLFPLWKLAAVYHSCLVLVVEKCLFSL